jgi:acyl carrier protein
VCGATLNLSLQTEIASAWSHEHGGNFVIGRDEIREKLRKLMADAFDLDSLSIVDATTAADIEEWDSLSHIRLMVAVERAFGFRLSNAEIAGLNSVGDLVTAIHAKAA